MQIYGSAAYRLADYRHHPLFHVRFTADERLLVGGCHGHDEPMTLQTVDVDGGAVVTGDPVMHAAVCGEVALAVPVADPTSLVVLRLPDLTPIRTIPLGATVTALDAAGAVAAAVIREPHAVAVVDARTWEIRRTELPGPPSCVHVPNDGTEIMVGIAQRRGGSVVLVDAADGTARHTLTWAHAPVASMARTGDRVLAAVGKRVVRWDLDGPAKATTLLTAKKEVTVIGAVPGGPAIVGSDHGTLVALDPVDGRQLWTVSSHYQPHVVGGRLVARFGAYVHDVDPHTGTVRAKWLAPRPVYMQPVAATERRIAVVDEARVRLLGEPGTWPGPAGSGHDGQVLAAAFDGDRFATSGWDERVVVWARGKVEPVQTIDGVQFRWPGPAVCLDGDDVYSTFASTVQRWSVTDGRRLAVSVRLRNDVTLLIPLPGTGLLLAATRQSRPSPPQLYALDAATLAGVWQTTVDRTLYRAERIGPDRLELHGDPSPTVVELNVNNPAGGLPYTVRNRTEGGPGLARDATVSVDGWSALAHHGRVLLGQAALGGHDREFAGPPGLDRVWWFPDGHTLLAATHNGTLVELHPQPHAS